MLMGQFCSPKTAEELSPEVQHPLVGCEEMKWISHGDTWEGTVNVVACACKIADD